MRAPAAFILSVFLVAVSSGCKPKGPGEAFDRLSAAADSGDVEGFLSGLTRESRALVEGVLSLRDRYPDALKLGGFQTRNRAASVRMQGELAVVTVSDASPERSGDLVIMRQEDGGWKLDFVLTEQLWNRNRPFFGATDGAPPGLLEPGQDGAGIGVEAVEPARAVP